MVIVKQELDIADVNEDDENQSTYYINHIDDDNIHNDISLPHSTSYTQSLVSDRPELFECYLCHKSWPTVGTKKISNQIRSIVTLTIRSIHRSSHLSFRSSSYSGYNFKMSLVWQMVENSEQFGASRQYAFDWSTISLWSMRFFVRKCNIIETAYGPAQGVYHESVQMFTMSESIPYTSTFTTSWEDSRKFSSIS